MTDGSAPNTEPTKLAAEVSEFFSTPQPNVERVLEFKRKIEEQTQDAFHRQFQTNSEMFAAGHMPQAVMAANVGGAAHVLACMAFEAKAGAESAKRMLDHLMVGLKKQIDQIYTGLSKQFPPQEVLPPTEEKANVDEQPINS
jgi:hypothetical protein